MMALYLFLVAAGCGLLADLWSFCLGDPHVGVVSPNRIFSRLGQWLLDRYDAAGGIDDTHSNYIAHELIGEQIRKNIYAAGVLP